MYMFCMWANEIRNVILLNRRIKQSVLARWRSKPKNHPAYEDEEHSLQGKTGKV